MNFENYTKIELLKNHLEELFQDHPEFLPYVEPTAKLFLKSITQFNLKVLKDGPEKGIHYLFDVIARYIAWSLVASDIMEDE